MQTKKPILFTGAFCFEEDWIEPILSVFPSVHYLPHFFSPHTEMVEIFSFEHEYPHIAPQENNPHASVIAEFFGHTSEQTTNKNAFGSGFKQLYQRFVEKYQVSKETKREIRPLIYDRHGIFLAEWLYKHYQTDVVILVQHPLSFVANWIKNNEKINFDELFSPKIANYAPNTFESIRVENKEDSTTLKEWEKAMRIWLVFAETIVYYQQKYPNWLFFRYEDFREAPERTLTDICDMLDLDYTQRFLSKAEESKTIREKDAQKIETDYVKTLINETQEYLTHFYPNSMIGKRIFR